MTQTIPYGIGNNNVHTHVEKQQQIGLLNQYNINNAKEAYEGFKKSFDNKHSNLEKKGKYASLKNSHISKVL